MSSVDRRGGFVEADVAPRVSFAEYPTSRGRAIVVGDRLWRLAIRGACATVTLPLGLNWSRPGATFDLSDRRQRARCYEVVLRAGMAEDLLRYVDGALLVDLWDELLLPAWFVPPGNR